MSADPCISWQVDPKDRPSAALLLKSPELRSQVEVRETDQPGAFRHFQTSHSDLTFPSLFFSTSETAPFYWPRTAIFAQPFKNTRNNGRCSAELVLGPELELDLKNKILRKSPCSWHKCV